MKIIALIFFTIFTVVQTAPAIKTVCHDISVSLFTPDEEKGSEKVNLSSIEEIKEKKIYFQTYTAENAGVIIKMPLKAFINQHKLPLPLLDRFTPPPNTAHFNA